MSGYTAYLISGVTVPESSPPPPDDRSRFMNHVTAATASAQASAIPATRSGPSKVRRRGGAVADVDSEELDAVVAEVPADSRGVPVLKVGALAVGDDDDEAVALGLGGEDRLRIFERVADARAAHRLGHRLGIEERRGVRDGREVLGQRHPADDLEPEDRQPEGIAFTPNGDLLISNEAAGEQATLVKIKKSSGRTP